MEVFNIGSGKSYSVREIVDKLKLLLKKEIDVKFSSKTRKNEVLDTSADIMKARKLLSWNSSIDLSVGLKKLLE